MRKRYHYFTMPDGSNKCMTIYEASMEGIPSINAQVDRILGNYKNKRRKRDAFEPGWQPNINEEHNTRGSYEKRLKELGLNEVGNEKIPEFKYDFKKDLWSEDILKEVAALDKDMSDRELDALKSGELLKDVEI